MDRAQVRQVVGRADRRFTDQDQYRVGDLPLGERKLLRRAQPEFVAQDSRNRVGVRIVRYLRPPVPGDRPAVQLVRADLARGQGRPGVTWLRAFPPEMVEYRY